MGAAVALYLQDSLLLLHVNEAVLVRARTLRGPAQRRWHAAFGAQRWPLAGREPWLPNPLTPHRPLFRLGWLMEGASASRAAHPTGLTTLPAARLLGVLTLVSFLCLFIALPCGLFWLGAGVSLWAAAALYATNLAIAAIVLFGCRGWPVARGARAAIAFESIVCPPLALNAMRKLCARHPLAEDFIGTARQLLDPAQFAVLLEACLSRIDEQLDLVDEQSRDYLSLRAARERLEGELAGQLDRLAEMRGQSPAVP